MLDELCTRFFREFARYEYCLKVTGLRYDKRDAKANWDLYAKEGQVQDVFKSLKDENFVAAVDYLLTNPPKKQIIKDGLLAWDKSLPTESDKATLIFILIRRVRNNLFHGGKFNGEWFAPERSELLMKHALIILETCAKAHKHVWDAYNGIY